MDSWKRLAELRGESWEKDISDLLLARQRIAELEVRLATPVRLPKTNGYWTEQEKAFEDAITLAKREIRLAGFTVEEDK
ncbi:TPA: hypothetical protein KEY88_001969 [Serratia marcescens]|nr:hypothetical protein [Serratia marcescens]